MMDAMKDLSAKVGQHASLCERGEKSHGGARRIEGDRGTPITFTFDGQLIEAFEGETVAAALLACGVQAIDTVYVDIAALEGLRRECVEGAWMGFTGKMTIHPSQIEVVNEGFTPSDAEIEESRELIAAFEENRAQGRMAFRFRGQMVDVPPLVRAQKVLERARAAGVID